MQISGFFRCLRRKDLFRQLSKTSQVSKKNSTIRTIMGDMLLLNIWLFCQLSTGGSWRNTHILSKWAQIFLKWKTELRNPITHGLISENLPGPDYPQLYWRETSVVDCRDQKHVSRSRAIENRETCDQFVPFLKRDYFCLSSWKKHMNQNFQRNWDSGSKDSLSPIFVPVSTF